MKLMHPISKLRTALKTRITPSSFVTTLAVVTTITLTDGALAQDVKAEMDSLLKPFRAIQPYIASQERFSDAGNREQISSLLYELRKNFHRLESVPSNYHSLPGFDENLRAVADLLDDSSRRFTEGKTSYSWWRLRKLPSDCFTCHATYKVAHHYSNAQVVDQALDPLNQGRFMLATRQFPEARTQFLKALENPENRFYFGEVLRSLLLISTRIDQDPSQGIATLRQALTTPNLPGEDAREVRQWIDQLSSWSTEKSTDSRRRTSLTVAFAEQLITGGAVSTPQRAQNDVALLRGTAILHQLLEQGAVKKEVRPQALYLLGFAYTKLPLFFSESWAEMYLERCIHEYPNSGTARRAFVTYRDQIVDDYTGTAGTEMPAEVKLHLEQLRRKAFGEADFKEVVALPHEQNATHL